MAMADDVCRNYRGPDLKVRRPNGCLTRTEEWLEATITIDTPKKAPSQQKQRNGHSAAATCQLFDAWTGPVRPPYFEKLTRDYRAVRILCVHIELTRFLLQKSISCFGELTKRATKHYRQSTTKRLDFSPNRTAPSEPRSRRYLRRHRPNTCCNDDGDAGFRLLALVGVPSIDNADDAVVALERERAGVPG